MSNLREDPVLVSARREALVVLVAWLIAMTWSVWYCYAHGYTNAGDQRTLADLKFVLGFPDWIFWGVIVPWGTCVLFSFFFGSVFMHDQELGSDVGENGLSDSLKEAGHA